MKRRLILLLPLIALCAASSFGQSTRYVSPAGAGATCSEQSPCTLSTALVATSAGDTILMLDGTYTGSSGMLIPPEGRSGTSNSPIRVRALNDGAVLIDGQDSRAPLRLLDNSWWVIEGINLANSNHHVATLVNGSNDNILRRLVAWDAHPDNNNHVFQVSNSSRNLLEDVAGFGSGRKTFTLGSSNADNNTIRRAWGMWNYSRRTDVKQVYSITYSSYNNICENCLGTWDADPGAESIDQRTILGSNQMFGSTEYPTVCSNSQILGSVGYILSGQTANLTIGILDNFRSQACMIYRNIVMYSEQNTPLLSLRRAGEISQWEGEYTNGTQIGTGSSNIQRSGDWVLANNVDVDTVDEAPNIWNGAGSSGARLCYRYEDGVLTSTPLWPWPMNQRIIDALELSGRSRHDVTAIMEDSFGQIPEECRGPAQGISPPKGPRVTGIIP